MSVIRFVQTQTASLSLHCWHPENQPTTVASVYFHQDGSSSEGVVLHLTAHLILNNLPWSYPDSINALQALEWKPRP